MTYPLPDRLAPIRAEVHRRKVAAMFAVIAIVLYVLAAFGVVIGSLSPFDLACLASAAFAMHFVWDVAVTRRD